MSRLPRLIAAGIWCAAVAAAAITAKDNAWFDTIAAASMVAAAAAVVWRWGAAGRGWWMAGLAASVAGVFALYAAAASAEAVCTARDASGHRVVIGTEFTEQGRQYHARIPNDDSNAILEGLGAAGAQAAWTEASIARCRLRLLLTGALWIPFAGVALMCVVALMTPAAVVRVRSRDGKRRVFISYNHGDEEVAARMRDQLRRLGLEVIFDQDSMAPGQRIEEFIDRSVRDADAVVSIVSMRSLLSAWVAVETVKSFEREESGDGKLFIPCALSDEFLAPDFRLKCTQTIDARLKEIEDLLPRYAAQKIDSRDLDEEKSRLFDLRNNLGKILARLKDSLCLDLREASFEQSLARLSEVLK